MQSWQHSKDPNDVTDLQFDWSQRMEEGESITVATVFVAKGDVVVRDVDWAGALVTFWVEGGTAGVVNTITCRVVTSAERVYDCSGRLRVKDL